MLPAIDRIVYGPFVALWLRYAASSWYRLPKPDYSPPVHAAGTYPDRILVSGSGASAGHGVQSHELGIPGYLARSVSAITGRATDVHIVVAGDMTAQKASAAIAEVDLSSFDSVLLTVGAVEALTFMPSRRWAQDLTALLDRVEQHAAPATVAFLLSIPRFARRRSYPTLLLEACNRSADRLNQVTRGIVDARSKVKYIVMGEIGEKDQPDARTYEIWADTVAPHIAAELARGTGSNPRNQEESEKDRQAALEAMNVLDLPPDPVLDELAARARTSFDTAIAMIALIDGQREKIASVVGIPASDYARQESLCAVTIRRREHLVIEDTRRDPRSANLRIVNTGPKVRFYAGYPIESPDGHRVGALCVLDTVPRTFSDEGATELRRLAQEAQRRLWELSAAATAGEKPVKG